MGPKKTRLTVGKKQKVLRPRNRGVVAARAAAESALRSIDSGHQRHAAPVGPGGMAAGRSASAGREAAVPVLPAQKGCSVGRAAAGRHDADARAIAVEALAILKAGRQAPQAAAQQRSTGPGTLPGPSGKNVGM